jgi:hypothetical protein
VAFEVEAERASAASVAYVFTELSATVPQLAWVELADRSFGSRTRYRAR